MKVLLHELRKMQCIEDKSMPLFREGLKTLRVLYCAICRTDAKMWAKGHRDLSLPRVLGHEISAVDETTGKHYTVWPGQSCDVCEYCVSGRENLCESMKILGFHADGGMSKYITVPEDSLVATDLIEDRRISCFAEPTACVFNVLEYCKSLKKKDVIIYGGGVVGSLAAIICKRKGASVTVVEKSERKISKTTVLFSKFGIIAGKNTNRSNFDIAINCCDSSIAFSEALLKLRKTGTFLFFSGLKKNDEIDTNILNLIHYKEIDVHGSYGPVKKNMVEAVSFCAAESSSLRLLIEKTITPRNVTLVMPDVLEGTPLKYIIDFAEPPIAGQFIGDQTTDNHTSLDLSLNNKKNSGVLSSGENYLSTIKGNIFCNKTDIEDEARTKIDCKTKPLGSLGKIEDIAVQMCCIQNTLEPQISKKNLIVFAGDHGVVEEGVSAYPAKVTKQMVENFLQGGAAINTFCKHFSIDLNIVDVGVASEFSAHHLLLDKKIGYGTKNFTLQKAMPIEDAMKSISVGRESFLQIHSKRGCDIVGIGEMGIGNTTSATAIIAAITGQPVNDLIGRGTGVDNEGVKRKKESICKALLLHKPDNNDPVDILSKIGGYEIAGMCGAITMAAEKKVAVVLDGLISTAAGLLCYLYNPAVADFLIAGHQSIERGQLAALHYMSLKPLINLDLRLGEGTGAAIAINITELACNIMRDMATFEEAGIDKKVS